MRLLLVAVVSITGALYSLGAIYFFTQQQLTLGEYGLPTSTELRHPEAMLSVARRAFDENDFSPPRLELVERAMRALPSYYQPAFLVALFHSNRLEEPERTHRAFEAALRRYPSNGRLHLAFAQWLWLSLSIPSQTEGQDSSRQAEQHLATSLQLEPDLAPVALEVLRRQRVPPKKWGAIFPDDQAAKRLLLLALSEVGERGEALALLRGSLVGERDARWLQMAAQWAFQWGALDLALETAERWQVAAQAGTSKRSSSRAGLFLARVHLEMGASDRAYETFREALDTAGVSSPEGLEMVCSMAHEYFRKGQVVLAQSLFAEAAATAPRYVPAVLGLGQTFRAMGETEEAMVQFRRVLELEPDNAVAEQELSKLLSQPQRNKSPRS